MDVFVGPTQNESFVLPLMTARKQGATSSAAPADLGHGSTSVRFGSGSSICPFAGTSLLCYPKGPATPLTSMQEPVQGWLVLSTQHGEAQDGRGIGSGTGA